MNKIMTVVGTRPELIKLSRVINEIDLLSKHILVHTGQNYNRELNKVFFDDLSIRKPDYYLDAAGKSAIETIGRTLIAVEKVVIKEKPTAMLIYGDTNSCMSALVAKRYQVPVFHMEAGNRSYDDRVPEEINRRIIDHISDINMPLTEHARRYLIAEGIKPETIIKIGSCMQEVLGFYKPKINKSKILDKLKLKDNEYFLVSAHREENVDRPDRMKMLIDTLNKIASKYKKTIVFSVHPRTKKRLSRLKGLKINKDIKFIKALGFLDFIKLQQHAKCVLSDSGTISEESSLLGLKSIMLRQAHERPEAMDEAVTIMSDLDEKSVLNAIEVVLKQDNNLNSVIDYEGGKVSQKVIRTILSYTSYVNRTVWKSS